MGKHKTTLEICLAAGPLALALAVNASGGADRATIAWLIIVLFGCTAALAVCRLRAGAGFGSLAFVGGFIFWYSFPAVLKLLSEKALIEHLALTIDDDFVPLSLLLLSLFLFAGISVPAIVFESLPAPASGQIGYSRVSGDRLSWLALFACLAGLGVYLLFGASLGELVETILAARRQSKPWVSATNLGDASTALGMVGSSLLIAGSCLLWIRTWKAPATRIRTGGIALFASAVMFLDGGTRSMFALIVMPASILIVLSIWKWSSSRAVIAVSVTTALLFFGLQFQLVYRTEGTEFGWDLFFEDWLTLGGSSDFFSETVLAVGLVPAEHEFFHESALLHFVISPIPRFLWPDKPIPEVVWFYSLHRGAGDIYEVGGNVLSGVVGQSYMSWGWMGVLLWGAGFGLAGAAIDARLARLDFKRDCYIAGGWIMLIVYLFLSYRWLTAGLLYPVLTAGAILYCSREKPSAKVHASSRSRFCQ